MSVCVCTTVRILCQCVSVLLLELYNCDGMISIRLFDFSLNESFVILSRPAHFFVTTSPFLNEFLYKWKCAIQASCVSMNIVKNSQVDSIN